MNRTVLILGAGGNAGRHSSKAFADAGWTVLRYDRKSDDMVQAAQGADLIVNALNPPAYKNWQTEIPAITQQVIETARVSGATVIVPGNVYNFASVDGVFDENTPHSATTRKGKVRIAMERQYREAAAHGVKTIILRAGSFIDPDGDNDVMGLIHMRNIRSGRITQIGGIDTRHAYCYLPDWARAAVQLADQREVLDDFEDIPFPGHHITVRELQQMLDTNTSRKYRINHFPWLMMRLLSPFWNLAYEMLEMRDVWETSHQLGADKFQRLLPDFVPTDLRTVMLCSLPESQQR